MGGFIKLAGSAGGAGATLAAGDLVQQEHWTAAQCNKG